MLYKYVESISKDWSPRNINSSRNLLLKSIPLQSFRI